MPGDIKRTPLGGLGFANTPLTFHHAAGVGIKLVVGKVDEPVVRKSLLSPGASPEGPEFQPDSPAQAEAASPNAVTGDVIER